MEWSAPWKPDPPLGNSVSAMIGPKSWAQAAACGTTYDLQQKVYGDGASYDADRGAYADVDSGNHRRVRLSLRMQRLGLRPHDL